jgi:hypothetical protein
MKVHSCSCTYCGAEITAHVRNTSAIAARRALRRGGAIVRRERHQAKLTIFCDGECEKKHHQREAIKAAAREAMEDPD